MALGVKTGGRQKGTPNKMTSVAKEAFALAFEEIGGAEALCAWAQENRTEFYRLFARLIPTESHLSGPDGDAIESKLTIEFVHGAPVELTTGAKR